MPWWIWLILALFMLAMIVAGLIYAALHGIRALKDMSDIGGQLGERVAAMGESGHLCRHQRAASVHSAAQRGTESLCRGPCGRDSQQGRQARAPHPGMGPLEAIQQLTESSNGTSPTP
mgnify:FL=1